MSKLNKNEIEITTYADESIDIEFGSEVPTSQEAFIVETFKEKGYDENLGKSGDSLTKEPVSSATWEYLKKEGEELPYWHPKAQMEHRKKLRTMETSARRTAAGIPAPAPIKVNPTSGLGPSGTAVRSDGMPLAGGVHRSYSQIPNKPPKPVLKGEEELKFNKGGQWALDKSNYGPRGASQYSDADNARRKENNVDEAPELGNMGRVKDYGPSNPKKVKEEEKRIRSMNRKQPVKVFSREEIKALNEKGAMGAGKLKKTWADHGEIPTATAIKVETPNKAEDIIANQLGNLLLNKSLIGSLPPAQPTDQQLFGHLVPTETQLKQADEAFNNRFNSFYQEVSKPVESQELSKSWGSRGNIKDEQQTEEEKRISAIPVDGRLVEGD